MRFGTQRHQKRCERRCERMEAFEEDEEVSFSGVSFSKRHLSSSHNSVTSMGSVETPTRTALKDVSRHALLEPCRPSDLLFRR